MNQNINKLRYFLFCLPAAMLLLTNCNKILQVSSPPNVQENSMVFSSDNMADASVNGIYSNSRMQMTNTDFWITNGGLTIYGGLCADELQYIKPQESPSMPPFENNDIDKNTWRLNSSLWEPAYRIIYHANACLEGLRTSTTLTKDIKNQLTGECLFVRSFFYFYLVNLFGDVPLVTSTDYSTNDHMPRTTTAVIYDTLENDLKTAAQLLTEAGIHGNKLRPNKWAAVSLLARLNLYKGDWAKAEQNVTDVVESHQYNILTDLNEVFKNASDEAIWQVEAPPGQYSMQTAEGYVFNLSSYVMFKMRDELLNDFNSEDERWKNWVTTLEENGITYYQPHKYKVQFAESSATEESYMMLRYAELFLIRAEARYHQTDDAGALADLDVLRQRAGLPLLSSVTPTPSHEEIRQLIEHERRIELFCEWGHRWLDMKRTPGFTNPSVTRADEILMPIKPMWQSTDILFPIPQQQISYNPFLTQNNGY